MAGRKPKPSALREFEGNPGKRPINRREPKFSAAKVRCPVHLDAGAKKEWRRLALQLSPLGMLTDVDVAAFAAYCTLYSRWVYAELQIQKLGYWVKDASGNPMPNPNLRISEKTLDQLRKYETEFGFTPASRSRIHVDAGQQEDPFADFMRSIGADDEVAVKDTA